MFKTILSAAACAATIVLVAGAQEITVEANRVQSDTSSSIRATDLIGMSLNDTEGQNLGKVTDIVLDLNNQRVDYLILNQGQQADAFIAVPPTVIQTRVVESAQAPQVIVDVPAARLQQAPTFTREQWSTRGFDPVWIEKNRTFYSEYSTRPNTPAERRIDRKEDRLERRLDRKLDRQERRD